MHRIANYPSDETAENIELIEQEPAPILFLTSAATDISLLAHVLNNNKKHKFTLRRVDKKKSTLKGLAPKRKKDKIDIKENV